MLATENSPRKIVVILAAAVLAGFAGCTPSGPRALLRGDELLRNGRPVEALKLLELARRAMPEEPRAWNLLGLAYHRAGQPQLAVQAYEQALAKDKSNIVAVAHYNLGCLLLEQNHVAAAADHFRSYTLTTNSAGGLVKLATAQLRLRRLETAEATFGAALRLESRNEEALNGVGVVHALKGQRDAIQYFHAALQANPKYAPAILNSGLLTQQTTVGRPAALQRFKDYLAVAPKSRHAPSVKLLVEQLEMEFAQQAAASNAFVNATLKSNALLAAMRATNSPTTGAPPRAVSVITNMKPVAAARTNGLPQNTNRISLATNTLPAPVESNPPITMVKVTHVPPPKVAMALPEIVPPVNSAAPVVPSATNSAVTFAPELGPSTLAASATTSEEPKKPGFFARLNPFRGKPKSESQTGEVAREVVLTPQTNTVATASKPTFPRYAYLSPAMPVTGNRANAERAMAQAIKAERAGNTNEAWLNYHLAIAADPTYFESQYNAALLAYRLGDWRRALGGFETTLALKPESIDARYNFALALKQADYAQDAAVELQRILEAKPNEVRAHLTLGNLYAQQLNEPQRARAHYSKVLELDPRNAQAAAIRFWLAANP